MVVRHSAAAQGSTLQHLQPSRQHHEIAGGLDKCVQTNDFYLYAFLKQASIAALITEIVGGLH